MEDVREVPSLDEVEWKTFEPTKFFDKCGQKKKYAKTDVSETAHYPVYSSQTTNGGIMGYVDVAEFKTDETHPFYVVFGTHSRAFHLAQSDFSASNNAMVLQPKQGLSRWSVMFLLVVWHNVIPDLGYANHWKAAQRCIVSLPVNADGEPDWDFMERYVKKKMSEML